MTVTFFVGKPRTGKTLHQTMNAYYDYQNGREIYANYNLHFPHIRVGIEDLLKIPFDDVDRHPKTIVLQEIDKWFDARRSGREENVYLSSLTGQSGKRNIDILYDSQFPTRIDKSLRDVTDLHIMCECISDDNKQPIAFQYTLIDLQKITTKTYLLPAVWMQQFYKLYDTYEATKPLVKTENEKKRT